MLVLTIKEGEGVLVGETMVHVLKMQESKVQLGFEGPKHIKILREELVNKDKPNGT